MKTREEILERIELLKRFKGLSEKPTKADQENRVFYSAMMDGLKFVLDTDSFVASNDKLRNEIDDIEGRKN